MEWDGIFYDMTQLTICTVFLLILTRDRDRTVTVPWPYRDRTVTVPWPYRDRTVTVPWPFSTIRTKIYELYEYSFFLPNIRFLPIIQNFIFF